MLASFLHFRISLLSSFAQADVAGIGANVRACVMSPHETLMFAIRNQKQQLRAVKVGAQNYRVMEHDIKPAVSKRLGVCALHWRATAKEWRHTLRLLFVEFYKLLVVVKFELTRNVDWNKSKESSILNKWIICRQSRRRTSTVHKIFRASAPFFIRATNVDFHINDTWTYIKSNKRLANCRR